MADKFYDPSNPSDPLPGPGINARLELQAMENVFIGLAVYNGNGLAIQANDPGEIHIGTAGVVRGTTGALEILAAAAGSGMPPKTYTVYNEGSISATGGYGIKVTETDTATGALNLVNSGSISASGLAVLGGSGGDHIVNTGMLRTTGPVLMDLGKGDDYYDGSQGTAIGLIKLGEGNDTAIGGAGSDVFSGGAGNDILNGGAGSDTADYSLATSSIFVDLSKTGWQDIGGGQGLDLLISIENVTGGVGGDTLTGNSGDNMLAGEAGDDVLEGGLGNDVLDGGDGGDTARYSGSAAVTVSLAMTGPQDTKGYGWDTLIGIENLSGGSGADTLTGDNGDNKLYGNSGNDTLRGGAGNDTLDGGSGINWAVFDGSKSDYTIEKTVSSAGVITATITKKDGTEVDHLTDIRVLKFENGSADDEIVALTNENPTNVSLSVSSVKEETAVGSYLGSLSGSDPDGDTLKYTLLSGTDKFELDDNRLYLKGGLDYETATSHQILVKVTDDYGGEFVKVITINVQNNLNETANVVRSGTNGSEEVVGEFGNDVVFGFDGDDRLFGQAGNDTLYGGNGNDLVHGGNGSLPSGNDRLYGGFANDTLIGGDGRDSFVFDTRPSSGNIDIIQDFKVPDDMIELSRAIFSKIAKRGTLSKDAFVVGDKVHDKSDRIIYVKSKGALFYDPDGTGKGKAVQFAIVEKNLALSHKDFWIF